MDSNEALKAKHSTQPPAKPQHRSQPIQQLAREPIPPLEIEQPEQPEPVVHLESLAEISLDASVYGSGWSITELMNEFGGRYDG